ncbi:MAG TPA: Spy/CpxP family protein refolding chaperone [Alphaproteobacteria bacterium]|jgi:hypothetical protein|nr:Spy/CpxP family protein refolding chaperone [Alphaproteobacteria bacterium]
MAWKSIILGSALTAAVAAGAFYAGSAIGPRPAWAESTAGHGWAERRHGGDHVGRLCESGGEARLDFLLAYARDRLALRADQAPAWRALEDAVRDGIATMSGACDQLRPGAETANAPARLAAAETAMSAGSQALTRVRPAFEAFYATLDDGQKATLEEVLAHRRRR